MAAPTLPRDRPAFRTPLAAGDIAPPCALSTPDGRTIDLRGDAVAGHPQVIAFWPRFDANAVKASMASLTAALRAIEGEGARVVAVSLANARAASEAGSPVPVLLDRDGKVFAAFGAGTRDQPTTIVLRQNNHVYAVIKSDASGQAGAALSAVQALLAERKAASLVPHPPILVVPDVLSPEDCRRLIQVYETRGNVFVEPGHGDDQMTTDYKMRIPEYGRADRIDHWIVDRDTASFIDGRLGSRLFPEIRKAFQYPVTRRERMRIGCYTGSRGGEVHGHRDDSEVIAAHRRFAMSINLNSEAFEGGALRFMEYGDQQYRPATGAAIVFSSSILHEALEVRSGRRFVLLAFLFGEF
ncbi:MAG TPA: redoxin domain-containing protein [Stellaceae bacterium]|nr:redoxin domain-containing protein [Stellaceae bacterium]